MNQFLRNLIYLCINFTVTFTLSANTLFGQSIISGEDTEIRALVTRFYDAGNAHDVEKMVSVYADSIDHVNEKMMEESRPKV